MGAGESPGYPGCQQILLPGPGGSRDARAAPAGTREGLKSAGCSWLPDPGVSPSWGRESPEGVWGAAVLVAAACRCHLFPRRIPKAAAAAGLRSSFSPGLGAFGL